MSATCAFFVIFFGKNWWVPNTNNESMIHLDEFQVSLNDDDRICNTLSVRNALIVYFYNMEIPACL